MGTGRMDTSVSVFNDGGGAAGISPAFGTESLTYNYRPGTSGVPPITPSLSVPERSPASLLACLVSAGSREAARIEPSEQECGRQFAAQESC